MQKYICINIYLNEKKVWLLLWGYDRHVVILIYLSFFFFLRERWEDGAMFMVIVTYASFILHFMRYIWKRNNLCSKWKAISFFLFLFFHYYLGVPQGPKDLFVPGTVLKLGFVLHHEGSQEEKKLTKCRWYYCWGEFAVSWSLKKASESSGRTLLFSFKLPRQNKMYFERFFFLFLLDYLMKLLIILMVTNES